MNFRTHSKRTFTFVLALVTLLLLTFVGATPQPVTAQTTTFRNPLNNSGPDPYMMYYNGNYYLLATTWTSELTMRRAPTIAQLKTATAQRIYFETVASRCCNFWAPELRMFNNRWYLYYTGGPSGTDYVRNQRSHVLESAGTDPMGPYTYKAKLTPPGTDLASLDGSPMVLNNQMYFLHSGWEGTQPVYIAPMSNPYTLSGPRVRIINPTLSWETQSGAVAEGPVALQHGGKTFIIYSASFCATANYKLGMMTYNGGDPLSASSWVKNPNPVFQRNDAAGVYGPGHNNFFKSPDGTEDWIIYHANSSSSGGCDMNRTPRIQRFTWNADGTPNFGVPLSTSTDIVVPRGEGGGMIPTNTVGPSPTRTRTNTPGPTPTRTNTPVPGTTARFKSFNFQTYYIRHANYRARIDPNVSPLQDSQFKVVAGLSNSSAISFESVNFPGYFLRRRSNGEVWLDQNDNTTTFRNDATWYRRAGLASSTWSSFESFSAAGQYMRHFNYLLVTATISTATDRSDATFLQE